MRRESDSMFEFRTGYNEYWFLLGVSLMAASVPFGFVSWRVLRAPKERDATGLSESQAIA